MGDELNVVPAEWGGADELLLDHAAGLSPFSIERLLPKDQRRFLQLREPFMVLCENFPVRAAILECARFETERRLRFRPGGAKTDLEWRETQHRTLLGPKPEEADLWAPFPGDRIVARLCGISTNKTSIGKTVEWLEGAGYIFTGKTERPRNGRTVLLNVKQIERDLRDSPFYDGCDFRPAVKGSPDQFMVEPEGQLFTPVYEGLSQLVVDASGELAANMETARAAMLLHRILVRAEAREKAGETVPAAWSYRHIHESFGWGSHQTWKSALSRLTSSNLAVKTGKEYSAPVIAPNLSRILYLTRGISEAKATDAPDHTFNRTGTQIGPIGNTEVTEAEMSSVEAGPQIEPNTPTLRTESFSESLTEYLSERQEGGSFDAVSILDSLSHPPYEVRRTARFVGLPVDGEWSQLSFKHLAKSSTEEAAAALELCDELARGVRPAIAFPTNSTRARATIAVMIGHWIDSHVAEKPLEWFTVDPDALTAIQGSFQIAAEKNQRKQLIQRLEETDSPLIVENIGMAGRNEQLRDTLVNAIRGRSENLMPVIYLGLPDTVDELRKLLKEDRLTDLVVRTLNERNQPFELAEIESEPPPAATGGEDENPFL